LSGSIQKQGYLYCGNCGAKVTLDMNFCPSCGAPFKSTALPTPIYSSVYMPTNKPTPNRTAAPLVLWAINAFIWGFFGFSFCVNNIAMNHLPTMPVLALVLSGICVAFFPTYWFTRRQLSNLETKNEVPYSSKKRVMVIVATIVALAVLIFLMIYFPPPNPPSLLFLPYVIIYPMPSTLSATLAVMYFSWQRKNHKKIYWENKKVIAVPTRRHYLKEKGGI